MKRTGVLCLLLALFSPALTHAENSVVNLSHYDEAHPAWRQMTHEGVIGAIHEATYPIRSVDTSYGLRQIEAVGAGLYWGAYHFGDATDPVRQADHYLDTVARNWRMLGPGPHPPGVLLVLDFEQNTHYPGGTMRVDQAAAFVKRVHDRTGRYPGLYSSENRIQTILNSPQVTPATRQTLLNCWLWIANYHHTPGKTAPWREWDLWQYTGDGICDLPRKAYPTTAANVRKCERDIFHGSTNELRAFWRRNGWDPSLSN